MLQTGLASYLSRNKIGLIDVDGHNFPNLALMKIAAYHKQFGYDVEWYDGFTHYDIVYKSKVFSYTDDFAEIINADKVYSGGTGYDVSSELPQVIDRMQPDYSIYPNWDKDTALGFLTRGCPNHCKWCIVPKKEGNIQPYMDIEELMIDGRKKAVLMDNNILACDYGIEQIEKIVKKGYRVDFNQALDARLITKDIAHLLAKVKWIKRIRFGCDTTAQIAICERAVKWMREYGYKGEVQLYTIITDDINECYNRLSYWKKDSKYIINAQPFRDFNKINQKIPLWQSDMARWAGRKELYKIMDFKDYSPRKGFLCKEYFKTNKL